MNRSIRTRAMKAMGPAQTGRLDTGANPYSTQEYRVAGAGLMERMTNAFMRKASLFSPGTQLANVLYADKENTAKHMLSMAARIPSKIESLSSKAFRSTGNVNISNRYPCHGMVLYLKLPHLPENVYLPRGWGYNAIRSVTYTYGASAGSNRIVNREQIKHKLILSAKTQEQLDALIRLGGDEVIAGQLPAVENHAVVLLGIPGSQIYGQDYKVPVPVNVFSGSYSISIEFSPLNEICNGTGLGGWGITEFADAGIFIREFVPEISDSIPTANQLDPEASIIYPFIYSDQSEIAFTPSIVGEEITKEIVVPSRGDLVGISMSVLERKRYSGVSPITDPVNAWNYSEIFDYKIRQGNVDLDSSPGLTRLNEVFNTIDGSNGAFAFTTSELAVPFNGQEPFFTVPVQKKIIYWNNAIQRAQLNESVSFNSPDYGQQSISLTFRSSAEGASTLYVVFHYTGFIEFKNGVARLLLTQP